MADTLYDRIFGELDALVLIDSHSHINPHAPASTSLADLLGYHYYTELAHSAGMPRAQIEDPSIDGREKVRRLFDHLGQIDNTIQWSWFVELAQEHFQFPSDTIDCSNWSELFDGASRCMSRPDWEEEVLKQSKVERIFLTNDFDDPLTGFDTHRYVPCLRTDDLVFHLSQPAVQERLERATDRSVVSLDDLNQSLGLLFDRFVSRGAKACAISLPPWFAPFSVPFASESVQHAFMRVLGLRGDADEDSQRVLANWVFWRLAEHCEAHRLPFDLMIGVNRRVYPGGVYQGQDLYDSCVSLLQYAELFNAFPTVKFPISVLASVTNQELVDYAWIFPNVFPHGHWWYSNTPTYIGHDLRGRLEAIPRSKILGYYSDAYKLEFILPKFRMYKRILSRVLADEFCISRRMSEEFAIALGKQILRGNVEQIFGL